MCFSACWHPMLSGRHPVLHSHGRMSCTTLPLSRSAKLYNCMASGAYADPTQWLGGATFFANRQNMCFLVPSIATQAPVSMIASRKPCTMLIAGKQPDDAVRVLPVRLRRGTRLLGGLLRDRRAAHVGGGHWPDEPQHAHARHLADVHVQQQLHESAAGPPQVRGALALYPAGPLWNAVNSRAAGLCRCGCAARFADCGRHVARCIRCADLRPVSVTRCPTRALLVRGIALARSMHQHRSLTPVGVARCHKHAHALHVHDTVRRARRYETGFNGVRWPGDPPDDGRPVHRIREHHHAAAAVHLHRQRHEVWRQRAPYRRLGTGRRVVD